MTKPGRRTAFASLDIGTSQIKLGVYCSSLSNRIILIDHLPNELIFGHSGEVKADYGMIMHNSRILFNRLGQFLKQHDVECLYLGICGHVSSLLEWDLAANTALENQFAIWLDTTGHNCYNEYESVMGEGRSRNIIGTFLPWGTNWLFTKLLNRRKTGFKTGSKFLQIGDALFYELTAKHQTHFSSQISMVNLKHRAYSSTLLDYLQLPEESLPQISYEPAEISPEQQTLLGLPRQSFVFPAMADLYTSLYGLRLNDSEGFMLANTSEQAGVYFDEPPMPAQNFLSISFDKGFVNYGSTNTGGNVVNWFVEKVLRKKVSRETMDELTTKAVSIEPSHTPLILPYLQGERAPLWKPSLTASILEIRSTHTDAHLFRAILESIAFARKQCFDELGTEKLTSIKIGGGSSRNELWNSIRASVLNKPVAVSDEKELALAGIIDYLMEKTGSADARPDIGFTTIEADRDLAPIYAEKYRRFISYQGLISSGLK